MEGERMCVRHRRAIAKTPHLRSSMERREERSDYDSAVPHWYWREFWRGRTIHPLLKIQQSCCRNYWKHLSRHPGWFQHDFRQHTVKTMGLFSVHLAEWTWFQHDLAISSPCRDRVWPPKLLNFKWCTSSLFYVVLPNVFHTWSTHVIGCTHMRSVSLVVSSLFLTQRSRVSCSLALLFEAYRQWPVSLFSFLSLADVSILKLHTVHKEVPTTSNRI